MLSKVIRLFEENLKTKNPVLDLGSCHLDGTEKILEKLGDCTHLQTLILANNWWESIQNPYVKSQNNGQENILKKIPESIPRNLQQLILSGTHGWAIQNYSFISELKELQTLYLGFNTVPDSDFSFLEGLEQLQNLDLSHTHNSGFSFLQNLPQLQKLNLSFNRIQETSFFKKLTQLKSLNLLATGIQDISFLQNLTQLQNLHLGNNPIQDVSTVIELVNLVYLDVYFRSFPPIWFAYLRSKKGKLGDYTHLPELPQVEKIWQLMKTRDDKNIDLAHQLALGQGWAEEEFQAYKNLL